MLSYHAYISYNRMLFGACNPMLNLLHAVRAAATAAGGGSPAKRKAADDGGNSMMVLSKMPRTTGSVRRKKSGSR